MKYLLIFIFFASVGIQLKAQGKGDRALELYEEALSNYRQGNLGEALVAIHESIRLNGSAGATYLLGLIHEARNETFQAIAAYEATLKVDAGYQEAMFQKAVLYLEEGDAHVALVDFTHLIEQSGLSETRSVYFQVDPEGVQQLRVVSMSNLQDQLLYYRGQAYHKLGDYSKALSDYNELILANPSVDAYISRALLFNELKREDSAKEDLKSALTMDSTNQLAWYNLALIDPATRIPDAFLADYSFNPILGLLGARAMETGDYQLAKTYYDHSLVNEPEDVNALISRGRALLKLGHYTQARKDFETALVYDESIHEALYLIGNAFFLDKKYVEAVSYYNRYLGIDSSNSMIWYNAGMCYLQVKNRVEACHSLGQAAALGMSEAITMRGKYCQ